jgi:hypothetical protein
MYSIVFSNPVCRFWLNLGSWTSLVPENEYGNHNLGSQDSDQRDPDAPDNCANQTQLLDSGLAENHDEMLTETHDSNAGKIVL